MSLADECRDLSQEASCRSTAGERFLSAGASGSGRSARASAIAIVACLTVCAVWFTGLDKIVAGAANSPAVITVDYPLNNSAFPLDMEAPTFQWRGSPGGGRPLPDAAFFLRGRCA